MMDEAHPPDPQPHPPPASVLPSSAATISVPHSHQTSAPLHYPPMYVDPLTAAATFYQPPNQHRQPQPSTQSLPSQPSTSTPPTQPSLSPHPNPPPPYYIRDPASVTAAALQHVQLQMHLHLQAQQRHHQRQHQTIPNSTTRTQPQDPPAPVSNPLTSIPQPVMAHIPSCVIPQPTTMTTPHVIGTPSPLQAASHIRAHIPAVPESQMASAYRIGRYTPAERRIRLERYREKRAQRNYSRRVKYDCRKMIADKRRRVQGRFVKREEEVALAAQQNGKESGDGEDGTDGAEDETKIHPLDSSGSGSSGPVLDALALSRRAEDVDGDCLAGTNVSAGFSEQSDQVLQSFR